MIGLGARLVGEDPRPSGFVAVCPRSAIGDAVHRRFVVDGRDILLVGAGGRVFALANRCPHMGKPLEGGRVTGMAFTCPFHAGQFDLETGRSTGFPKTKPATMFPVRVEGDEILVQLHPPASSGGI